MTLRLENVTFDCHDALLVGRFWSAALGRPLDSSPEPSENFASIGMGDDGQESWLFARVPGTQDLEDQGPRRPRRRRRPRS